MKTLIQALNIFLKYKDVPYPTHCEHDILLISEITFDEVSKEDKDKLNELGFRWSNEYSSWSSFRYGSS